MATTDFYDGTNSFLSLKVCCIESIFIRLIKCDKNMVGTVTTTLDLRTATVLFCHSYKAVICSI